MEILSPHIFSVLSTTNRHSIIIYTTRNPRNFRVSAHLTGRRKNHLRKKLIEQQVLRQTPSISLKSPIDDEIRSNSDDSLVGFNQNEILTTTRIEPEPSINEVHDNANLLAKEVPNSSIAKLVNSIGKPKLTRVGVSVFCLFLVFISFDRLFRKRNEKKEYSGLEKEMLRRKIKARMAKQKASLEVIQDSKDPELDPEPDPEIMTRPQLDKEELMDSIVKMDKIQEIRAMARHARELESNGESIDDEPNGTDFDVQLPQDDVSIQDSSDNKQPDSLTIPPIAKLSIESGSQDSSAVEGKESNLFDNGVKLRIISSVKEAKEYLHKKEKKQEPEINNLHQVPKTDSNDDVFGNSTPQSLINNADDSNSESVKGSGGDLGRANREKWIEDNFHEFEPLVEKIRGGFRNNYMVAREKVKQDMDLVLELERDDNESEFEWMKDEKLREIVFQVRENELMGRDPFYLMDAQDKALFFKGLEEKVEKENEKLAHLHEYLHSNIENLDYGADGISLYDSPEKIIPRWKGPTPTTAISQEFLDNYLDQRKALFAETLGNLDLDLQNISNGKVLTNKQENENIVNKSSKTVIEGSDGSVKTGKKSGKEFWEHTKKWSRGFLDSYNAENDPETKAAMKDIGKDLERWITEKEIQEAADVMDKVPDKGKKLIEERINKLKREMELFGPEAVVSKYSEYGDEEEEIDYYWWLDLPHLLCIEIYIDERIGFYSLEMASDLELDPKPHHIIAFEDAGDCKNLCYLIQTHMETLGNGNAFVVPQMPKDTYREAKENGFNVTVIRKGEVKLDVDQPLEEVEEMIVEIGSKMYHDQIMKSRNVNIDSVMKGVFGLKKNTKRRRLKRPTK